MRLFFYIKQPYARMNLTTKMIAAFMIVLMVSTIGFGIVVYKASIVSSNILGIKDYQSPHLAIVNKINYNSLAQASAVRGYVLTGQDRFAQDYQKAADENSKLEAKLIADSKTDELKKLVAKVKELDDKYSEIAEKKIFPLVKAGNTAEAVAVITNESAPVAKDLADNATKYMEQITKESDNALNLSIGESQSTKMAVIYAAIISLVFGIIISIFSARTISRPINALNQSAKKVADCDLTETISVTSKDEIGQLAGAFGTMVNNLKILLRQINSQAESVAASSEQLTASADQSAQASNQIAASITEVANGTERQLKTVTTASNAAENMLSELQEVTANVNMVAERAAKAAESAINGGNSASRAVAQMKEVEKSVSESAAVITELGERSKEIGQIVDTISGIAGQTNLLALNAAIEAARAGEQGRGFAVVAEEVRKLAEQSQEAAKRIATLIAEVQNETNRAVTTMKNGTHEVELGANVVNETGMSFQEIVKLVEQVSNQVKDISLAVGNVAKGSEQIVSAVQDIDSLSKAATGEIETVSAATEEQSASMQEIAAASQNLSKMAQEMQVSVLKFKV